eukprot:GHRQ01035782.1.p1 GENE.GHRQ01035782.1~~GHRQ01035782.1.p1  ORF type:complete len:189 (+),score=69.64 GHRQ01035782.1:401-967(+)
MEIIARETVEADKVKKVVSQEEALASAEAAKVQAIKDECEADLAEALPALQSAVRALDTLTKNDITEVKGMKSPPAAVRVVLEAVCILKGIKPVRFKDPQSGQMVDSYWEASKKMLMDEEFLLSLRYNYSCQNKTYSCEGFWQPLLAWHHVLMCRQRWRHYHAHTSASQPPPPTLVAACSVRVCLQAI